MRTLTVFVVVVVAAVVVSSCAPAVNEEQEIQGLLAADAAWSETAKARDFEKFLSFMMPDATMMLQGSPAVSGHQAIRDNVGPMFKAPGFELSWQASRAEVAESGNLGYTVGTYKLTLNNAAGAPATDTGKFLTTWEKVAGAWKVLDDMANSDGPTPISSAHVVMPAAAIKWIDPPPFVPPGAKMAAISGDPSRPEPFTVRLQLPAGYRLAPHWHPTDEHVTVLSGTFAAGMGDTFDQKTLADLPAGSYAVMTATTRHFALAKTAVTLQVHGMGPFVVNYVNPSDNPAKR